MQLDENEIWSALLHPSRSDLPLDDSNGSIQVAYRILCDQQRHSLLLLHEMNHEMKVDIGSDNAPADKTNGTQDESLNISSTINNDQQQHQQFVQPVAPRWHFGIRSKSSPREILLELYKVLQRLDMSWCDPTMALRKQRSPKTPQALQSVSADYFAMTSTKEPWGGKNEKEDVNNADEIDNLNLIDPYRIRVRARNNLLVFELQLYSTGGEAAQEIGGRRRQQSTNNRSSQNSYVVDVKCCPDDSPVDPVLFLETVGQLISELINSS
jgi:hypothetical protein